jgi:hypothetical protein
MKTHSFDALSFMAGLFITAIGLTFLLLPGFSEIVDFLTDSGAWFWPVVLIAIGVGVLAPLAVKSTRRDDDWEDQSEVTEVS